MRSIQISLVSPWSLRNQLGLNFLEAIDDWWQVAFDSNKFPSFRASFAIFFSLPPHPQTSHWLVFWGAKFLHLTRSEGGMPNFFFLLSVSRLKKKPHVGFPTVLNGAIELELLWRPPGLPTCVFWRSMPGTMPCVASLSSNIIIAPGCSRDERSTLKWRLYLLLRPRLWSRWASNFSQVTVFGWALAR